MGLSFTHLILIVVILLLVFGPQRIEGIGVSLGKAIRGFKKGIEGLDEEASKPTQSSGSASQSVGQSTTVIEIEKKKESPTDPSRS